MASIVRVTGSGQITIPAEMRKQLNIQKGDSVLITKDVGQARLVIRRNYTAAELAGRIPALDRDDVDDDFGNIIREAMEERAAQIVARMNGEDDEE